MKNIADNFIKQDFDTKLAIDALNEVLHDTINHNNIQNSQISSIKDEIKRYLLFLLDEKNIPSDEIYDSLEENEIQKLYNKFKNIPIDFFENFVSYNIWNEYINKGCKAIYFNNASIKYKAICGNFVDLGLEELYELDNLFGEEADKKISTEFIKKAAEDNIIIH